jgi:hypothetical protein
MLFKFEFLADRWNFSKASLEFGERNDFYSRKIQKKLTILKYCNFSKIKTDKTLLYFLFYSSWVKYVAYKI